MVDPALNAAIISSMSSSSWAQAAQQSELRKAIKHLKKASKYGDIKFTLSEDQVRQITEAAGRGEQINLSIGSFSFK